MPWAIIVDPVLDAAGADEVVRIWHDFGSYRHCSNEGFDTQLAPELPQRCDARENFVRTGGRSRREEDPGLLGARTSYFVERPASDVELGRLVIDRYIRFPAAEPA